MQCLINGKKKKVFTTDMISKEKERKRWLWNKEKVKHTAIYVGEYFSFNDARVVTNVIGKTHRMNF